MGNKIDMATFLKFVQWCATPSDERTPATQKEWAKQHKLTPETLSHWRDRKEFAPAYDKEIRRMLDKARPDIIKANISVAKIHDAKGHADRKTALTMTGDFEERQHNTVDSPQLDEFNKSLREILDAGTEAAKKKRV